MTIDDLIRRYIMSPRHLNLAYASQRSYSYAMEVLKQFFGKKDIKKIRRSDLLTLQEKLSHKPGLSNLACRVASLLFEYAVDLDILPFNPAARIKKHPGGSLTKWTMSDVNKALTECNDIAIVKAIALGWYTGQRESDILELRWRDIQSGYINTVQNKTKLEMKIRLHPDIVLFLEGVRGGAGPDDFIVSGRHPMTPAAFRVRFRRKMDAIGISKTFHGVRKGVACSLAERGGSIKEIAAILGHKTMRMAAYYAEQADNTVLAENAVSQMASCLSGQGRR